MVLHHDEAAPVHGHQFKGGTLVLNPFDYSESPKLFTCYHITKKSLQMSDFFVISR